ncbi:MAG: LysM peptidoglycan-binding domain-containing protein [Opitutaceae bacterium]|nr:LysM peptidoglycan-binding domain-containing protein [Opitutaceae bacterium]
MPFRLLRALFLLLATLLLGAGCGRNDDTALVPELDDANYKHAKQLQRHGRNGEALNAFLKVIETRGPRAAPESHLEAGVIYLHHSKNPIEAIHHLNKYLELRPNAVQAPYVRELINTATREFALRLPARPFDDQSVRLAENKEIDKLRRENNEMRAELATLRGGGATPVPRFTRPLTVPDELRAKTAPPPASALADSPIRAAPAPATPDTRVVMGAPPATSTPARTTAKSAPPATSRANAASGRTHTVAPKESLWGIARKYYNDPTAARVQAIYEANRNVMSSPTDLKIGMTLKIP